MRRILRAVFVVGLSSVVVVVLGAARYKLVALGLGAEGIGSLGILTSIVNVGVVVFSVGLSTSGVQAIAAIQGHATKFPLVRAGLLRGATLLGVGGGIVTIAGGLLGGIVSSALRGDPFVSVVLGITLTAMVISGAQLAYLNGLGMIKALAVCNGAGAILGTALTALTVLFARDLALVTALAAPSVAVMLFSTVVAARARRVRTRVWWRDWVAELGVMGRLGGIVMLGQLITNGSQVAIRLWVETRFGLGAVGHFQAAWTITSLYAGFILSALAAEYFPRISARNFSNHAMNQSVDFQIRVTLLLAGPALLVTILIAPTVLTLLYSSDFSAGVTLLRLQLVGDVLKIVSWVIAFLLLAKRASRAYLIGELAFNSVYVTAAFTIPGDATLMSLGYAYMLAYGAYLFILLILCRQLSGLRLSRNSWSVIGMISIAATAVAIAAETKSSIGYALAIVATVAGILYSIFLLVALRRHDPEDGLASTVGDASKLSNTEMED